MKKLTAIIISLVMAASVLVGCVPAGEKKGKFSIVCTVFPQYDWINSMLGENPGDVDVTLLISNGVDLHSYQPTVKDIAAIASCDMFVYIGGESEAWVEDVVKKSGNEKMKALKLLDVLGDMAKEEEPVEGGEENDHDHEHDEKELDEHIWLSLKNADFLCEKLSKALGEMDVENKEFYETNYRNYSASLKKLDQEYENAVQSATVKTLVFGDRFPFRYLVDDYNIEYYAAFNGCSAESNASFQTITFLAKKVDELALRYVIAIDGGDKSVAKAVVNNTKEKNQQILTLDSLQAITKSRIDAGENYLSVMTDNLAVIKTALGANNGSDNL